MATAVDKLSDIAVKSAKPRDKPYKLSDGKGLYLEVMPNGSRYWRLKYRYGTKEKRLAIGVYPEVTLKAARIGALAAREAIRQGEDPSQTRREHRQTRKAKTLADFRSLALAWYEHKKPDWTDKHSKRVQWLLEKHLFPSLGHRPIEDITAPELVGVLKTISSKGTHETAQRAKRLTGQILSYAVELGKAQRNFTVDLKDTLPTPNTRHLPSITNPDEVGKLLLAMDNYTGTPVVKAALLLSPLFFCRPGELRQMEWADINWTEKRVEIPAHRIKTREQGHIIPLSTQAITILQDLQKLTGRGKYVFPSARGGSRPLSENGVRTALRTLGFDNDTMTPHGFRAMARTILDEVLGYRVDWIEHQLAHAVKDPNGRAYNRTAHLEGRREMMQGWADYLDNLRANTAGA